MFRFFGEGGMRHVYHKFVAEQARLLNEGVSPRGPRPAPAAGRQPPPATAPQALIFAPHPDDECIIGALPLRLLRELKMRVADIAVTLGSRKDRRQERWQDCARPAISWDSKRSWPRRAAWRRSTWTITPAATGRLAASGADHCRPAAPAAAADDFPSPPATPAAPISASTPC